MVGVSKVTVSLSPEVLRDIDYISSQLGMSRSSFINAYLRKALPPAVSLVGQIPAFSGEIGKTPEAMRLRGLSVDIIKDKLSNLFSGLQDDLFAEK